MSFLGWEEVVAVVIELGEIGPVLRQALEVKIEKKGGRVSCCKPGSTKDSSKEVSTTTSKVNVVVFSGVPLDQVTRELKKRRVDLADRVFFKGPEIIKSERGILCKEELEDSQSGPPVVNFEPSAKKIKTDLEEELKDFYKGGCRESPCKRSAILQHQNLVLASRIEELSELQGADISDPAHEAKSVAYERILSLIRALPMKLTLEMIELIKPCNQLGDSGYDKIKQILQTGTCDKLEKLRNDDNLKAILNLSKLHGIGLKKASDLVKHNIKNVHELSLAISEKSDILQGLRITEDIKFVVEQSENNALAGWSLLEVESFITQFFVQALNQTSQVTNFMLRHQIVGGFSRGKQYGHDLDILISIAESSTDTLSKFISADEYEATIRSDKLHIDIIEKNFLDLASKNDEMEFKVISVGATFNQPSSEIVSGLSTAMFWVFFKDKWRRVDFVFVSKICWPYAVLGWNGSRMYERDLRMCVSSIKNEFNRDSSTLKFQLTSSGLYLVNTFSDVKLRAYACQTEEQILQVGTNYCQIFNMFLGASNSIFSAK